MKNFLKSLMIAATGIVDQSLFVSTTDKIHQLPELVASNNLFPFSERNVVQVRFWM
ncbi:MAG: hypothetical protein ACYDH1_12735 [Anaerolineaceae bacterium]